MQFLSIAWRTLVNLVTGAVILAMFHFTSSRFETIVASALVLIYVTVIGSYMSLRYALSRKWNIDLARYIAIAKALRLNTEIDEEAQKENQEEDRKGQTVFWITAGFNTLFGLIAIGNLLYAISS
jgi:DMSO/TMAO reductase YedYZ heme-binding membrane subunit